jgi:hypothetical protein
VVQREREPKSLLAPHNLAVVGVVGLVVVAGAIAWPR